MSGFGSINQFGSLTVNGKKLTFEDFDKDKNGEISTEEYNALLKEVKLDTLELSSVDKNGDQVLSTEEFGAWENKIAMQDVVNAMAGQISKDFTGKTQYLAEVKTALPSSCPFFTGAQIFSSEITSIFITAFLFIITESSLLATIALSVSSPPVILTQPKP